MPTPPPCPTTRLARTRAPRPLRLAACALLCAAAALPAAAQDKDKSNRTLTLGNGPQTGKLLTKSQLEECVKLKPQLMAQADKAKASNGELTQLKTDFDKIDAQLKTDKAGLDASNKAAVDAYNANIDKRRQLMDSYNAKRPLAAEDAQRYNAMVDTYKSGCENRPYKEDDYASIPRSP